MSIGIVFDDDVIDGAPQNSQLDPLKEEEKWNFFKKFPAQKRQNVYLSAMDLKIKEIKSPLAPHLREEKKKKIINLFSILKKAKTLVLKVKRNIYFKNYTNMTVFQKKILNDLTVFPSISKKIRSKVLV